MPRKTVAVARAITVANNMLRQSTTAPAGRRGVIVLLETLLHETGNYRGFGYLTANEVPAGHVPGIIRGVTNAENTYPDETRRHYYGGSDA